MLSESTRRTIETRLSDERGRIVKSAPLTVALAYPSPYHIAMSSLGYQRIYRAFMDMPGVCCERAFLPDGADRAGLETERPVTYESLRGLGDFPIIASRARDRAGDDALAEASGSSRCARSARRTRRHSVLDATFSIRCRSLRSPTRW